MLFGALFSTYILLRVGAAEWPHGELNVPLGDDQHRHPDRLVGDDGDGVGVAEDERLRASTGCI